MRARVSMIIASAIFTLWSAQYLAMSTWLPHYLVTQRGLTPTDAIAPYAEQKRELRKEFKEQGWLSKDEISMTVKAYRMMKNEVDMEQFMEVYDSIASLTGGQN